MGTWRTLLARLLLSLVVLSSLFSVPVAVAQSTDTGWVSPSTNGGLNWSDRDGAYANSGGYAEYRSEWDSDNRAVYWGYGLGIPSGATIEGIEVRLDWWLDGTFGSNYLDVDLSWDGGGQWTSVRQATTESGYDRNPTDVLGAGDDTWGRTWAAEEFSDANFRVRVRASTDRTRHFYLDWVPVRVTYSVFNNPPDPPTNLLCEGQTNPANVADTTPDFAWTHGDPDGDTQSAWQVQVGTDSDWGNGAEMWNSGPQSSSEAVAVYGGSTLYQDGVTYYWRVRTWDSHYAEGAWSATQQFTMHCGFGPHDVPGRVEAEDYRCGGEGVAYHDRTLGNESAPYRNDGVDVILQNGGVYYLGYLQSGEWLEYDVTVGYTGAYDIDFRVASSESGSQFHLEVDGSDVTGSVSVPSTGGWTAWQTVTVTGVSLTAGNHTLRLVIEDAWFTIDYIEFTSALNCDALSLGSVTFIDHEALGMDGGRVALRIEGAGIALPVTSVAVDWQHLDDLDDTLDRGVHVRGIYLDPTDTDFQGGDFLAQNMDDYDSPSTADGNPQTLPPGGGYILLDFDTDPNDIGGLDELPWNLVGTDFGFTVEFDGCPGLTLNRIPRDQPPPPEPCTFFEAGGQVVLEAEHYLRNVTRGGHSWQHGTSQADYSAWGYMEAQPNNGTNYQTYEDVDDSPYLEYPVFFSTPGTYSVWVRGWAANEGDDSLHVGLDGIVTDASDRISNFAVNRWDWSSTTLDSGSPVATVYVDEAGLHVFSLFMREDGFQVDKIILTTQDGFTPSGTGPAESYCCEPLPPPPTPAPPPGHRDCSQVLLQGNFEGEIDVSDGGYWHLGEEFYAARQSSDEQHSGQDSLALRAFSLESPREVLHPWAYQQVTFPPDVVVDTELALTLYYYVDPQSPSTPRAEDVLYVKLRDAGGSDMISDTVVANGASTPFTWAQYSVDLAGSMADPASYADRDVQLYFHAPNPDDEGTTGFFLDDVRLDVCNTVPIPEIDPDKRTVGGNLRVWMEGKLTEMVGVTVWAYRTDGGECRPGQNLCVTTSIHDSTYHFYNIEPGAYVIYSEMVVGTQLKFDSEAVTLEAGDVILHLAL